jgi:hypothetical protein
MAINFLNTIDLNKNQLNNAAIQNLAVDPGTGVEGQIYFNTADDALKIYAGGVWVEVGATSGVETLIAGTGIGVSSATGNVTVRNTGLVSVLDGTYIDLTKQGGGDNTELTADLSAADGTAVAATRFLTKDNTWATVPQGDITEVQGGTYISVTNQTGPIPVVNHDATTRTDTSSSASPGYGATFTAVDSVTSNATGHITALNLKTVTMPSAEAYTFNVTGDSGTNQVINSGNTLDIAGGTNITTVVGATDTVTVNLNDSITLSGSLTVNGISTFNDAVTIDADTSITGDLNMNTAKIINLADPTANQDAATKNYVDSAIVGGLVYQGGYNAATNTPDLTTSPNSIKKGWTYTVTADGTFFGEQLRIGDVLIAEQDNPSALANWTTVQNNIDLADLTTVGIGNVNAGGAIDVAYSNGTATVSVEDSSATNKGAVIVAAGTGISVGYASGTATVTNTQTNASNTFAATIAVSGAVTHSFGTKDVIVQLYDVVTDETVYADVDRNSTSQVTVTFASTPTNSVRVLVQKIGSEDRVITIKYIT